jgi:hypothetical protein
MDTTKVKLLKLEAASFITCLKLGLQEEFGLAFAIKRGEFVGATQSRGRTPQ